MNFYDKKEGWVGFKNNIIHRYIYIYTSIF